MLRVARPEDLRRRAENLLRVKAHQLGQRVVECPCCTGLGWWCVRELVVCPVCFGFRELPQGMARWFEMNAARIRAGQEPIREEVQWNAVPSVWETRGALRCSIALEPDMVYSDLTV